MENKSKHNMSQFRQSLAGEKQTLCTSIDSLNKQSILPFTSMFDHSVGASISQIQMEDNNKNKKPVIDHFKGDKTSK